MHAQFWVTAIAFIVAIIMAALSATSILPGHAAAMDAWHAARPTVPRRWLMVAFWSNLVLPIATLGIFAGTAGQFLNRGMERYRSASALAFDDDRRRRCSKSMVGCAHGRVPGLQRLRGHDPLIGRGYHAPRLTDVGLDLMAP